MKVLFFGTPDFAVPTLEQLYRDAAIEVGAVFTQPDKPAGRGSAIKSSPVKECALVHNTQVFQPTSLRREFAALRGTLEKLGPFDIGIVVAFGQILPAEVLSFPRCGCLNIHASLLPRWRGAAPIQRAIQAGDRETGVCLMQMDAGLDTGPVFAQERTPIEMTDTAASLHDRLAQLGANLLMQKLESIVTGAVLPQAQPSEGVTYASKISNQECRIDWSLPAESIALSIRAFSPHPGCYSLLRNKRLKILQAKHTGPSQIQVPGTVTVANSDRLEIACGDGSLRIEELQIEGKKRTTPQQFLRGNWIAPGEVLN